MEITSLDDLLTIPEDCLIQTDGGWDGGGETYISLSRVCVYVILYLIE